MLMNKQKKNQSVKGNRILISITVIGSAGPIRFVVNEEELVGSVIDMALKAYAREGRLPLLGSDMNQFLLYCPHAATAVNTTTSLMGTPQITAAMMTTGMKTIWSLERNRSRFKSK